MILWIKRHRHILLLNGCVCAALVAAHFAPAKEASLLANLLWLFAF